MVKGIEAVAVGLVVFILAQKLIATLITGTDTGSVIIQTLVSLLIAFGVMSRNTAPSYSNVCRITHLIRGKLNLITGKLIAELNQRMNLGNCGETRRWESYKIGLWYSPIRLERASQILYPDFGRFTDRIRRSFLSKRETLESNLHSKQRKFGESLNCMKMQQANAEPSRESSDFRACVETRNVRPTVSNRGRWHSPLSCESMS